MKAFAIVHHGFEEQAAAEISKLTGTPVETSPHILFFECTLEQLCTVCYRSQSIIRAGVLLESFTMKSIEELVAIEKCELGDCLKGAQTFCVRAKQFGIACHITSEVEAACGGHVLKAAPKISVNLTSPDVQFLAVIVDTTCYFGIDLVGFDLSKRDYKVFGHRHSLNGSVAFGLVQLAHIEPGMNILDPFCGSGTICIEAAAQLSCMPPSYYKKERFLFRTTPFVQEHVDTEKVLSTADTHITEADAQITGYDRLLACVRAAQKNAKIAGVSKHVAFSRADVEWLDTKFDENSIDWIITHPPEDSQKVSTKQIEKLYREFFYQAEFVVKDTGHILTLSNKKELLLAAAEKSAFSLVAEQEVFQGQMPLFALTFKNSPKKDE